MSVSSASGEIKMYILAYYYDEKLISVKEGKSESGTVELARQRNTSKYTRSTAKAFEVFPIVRDGEIVFEWFRIDTENKPGEEEK